MSKINQSQLLKTNFENNCGRNYHEKTEAGTTITSSSSSPQSSSSHAGGTAAASETIAATAAASISGKPQQQPTPQISLDLLSLQLSCIDKNKLLVNTLNKDVEATKKLNCSEKNNGSSSGGGGGGDEVEEQSRKMQQLVELAIGDNAKQQVLQLLDKISLLSPPERLLLYLRMPSGTPETDPLRQPQNPLGTRSEINHTINWVRSHLEHDPNVSIPKQDVYDDYVSYCTRVEIKPLSTADFGKVMKQVFPGIRPRRLGTRGHSRYCYAAMRKATKLDPPRLPDLELHHNEGAGTNSDDNSWKVVKTWAEGLLKTPFDSVQDLSEHIQKHLNLSLNGSSVSGGGSSGSAGGSGSRQLVPKKIQKELKDKKKLQNLVGRGGNVSKTKRRKRKSFVAPAQEANIKTEIDDELHNALPMNLAANDGSSGVATKNQLGLGGVYVVENNSAKHASLSNIQGTNLTCDNLVVDCNNLIKAPDETMGTTVTNIKSEITSTTAVTPSSSSGNFYHGGTGVEMKEPAVYCKKVRQAQQSKNVWGTSGLAGPVAVAGSGVIQYSYQGQAQINKTKQQQLPPSKLHERSPLAKRLPVKETVFNVPYRKKIKFAEGGLQADNMSMMNEEPINLNISEDKQQQQQQQHQQQQQEMTGAAATASNFIIPRERVISICNLDKDALDDYLNGGDNSQEQEAELLQYFQNTERGVAANAAAANIAVPTATTQPQHDNDLEHESDDLGQGQVQNSIPILENYHIYDGENAVKIEKPDDSTDSAETAEKLSQLRSYLQQNLHNTIKMEQLKANPQLKSQLQMAHAQQMYAAMQNANNYPGGSASASLALMSQRHITNDPVASNRTSSGRGPKRKLNLNIESTNTTPSPNARRRDLNFVPISPGPFSPQVSSINNNNNSSTLNNNNNNSNSKLNANPFLSPRAAQLSKHKALNRTMSMNSNLPLLSMPSGGQHFPMDNSYDYHDNGRGFSKPKTVIKSEISASAPPSPIIHQMRYGNSNNPYQSYFGGGSSNQQHVQQQHTSPDIFPPTDPLESRSQSVPLHSYSPSFAQIYNYSQGGFASTCNSVVPTPVPSEFTDFNNSSILDMLAAETPQTSLQNVKIENEFMPLTGAGINDMLPNYNPISRSVPSTPLPLIGYGGGGGNGPSTSQTGKQQLKHFDISKSVPTTPNTTSAANTFRYSPRETHRDFLINGNSMDPGKVSSFYQSNNAGGGGGGSTTSNSLDKELGIEDEIDELTSFDAVDVSDPIIGSDLLNNL